MLGFAPFSGAALADAGSGELLFIPTGVVGTTAVGSVTVTGDQIGLTLGSVAGTALVNPDTVVVDAGAIGTFAIDQLNGLVGSITAAASAGVAVTGVSATSAVGSTTAVGTANIAVTSPQLSGVLGSPILEGDAVFAITGVAATGAVDEVTIFATENIVVPVTNVAATGAIGTVILVGTANVFPDGVQSTGEVGSPTITGTTAFSVAGVSGTAVLNADFFV